MESVIIHTDGGCSGNPGPGGWAFVYESGEGRLESSGGERLTTNNRMELTAVIEALGLAASRDQGSRIVVHTDSQYVKNGIQSWIHAWKRNGWRTSDKKAVKNRDLWERLDALARALRPEFVWVKGHAGIAENEACDALVQLRIADVRSPGAD